MSFMENLNKRLLFFDGAMGTLIQKAVAEVMLPETVNIKYPEVIKEIHRQYSLAGADIITTNTFGANEFKLEKTGLTLVEVIQGAVRCAKEAAPDKYIALDIGPLGKMFEPGGSLTFDEAYSQFKKQVLAGVKAGCDLIIIETMSDLYEAKAAILAAKENSELPVICTMTFTENNKTFIGTDPLTMVAVLEGLGVDALGVNCSFGPDRLMPVIKEVLKYASVPVIVQPNAGMPAFREGETIYDISKEQFLGYMKEIAEAGASILGGCCGTTPEYIEMLTGNLKDVPVKTVEFKKDTIASSYRKSVVYDGKIVIAGEGLITTGKPKYCEALLKGNYRFIVASARDQKNKGADLVNINTFIPKTDEKEFMLKSIYNIQKSLDIPLQIDSSDPEVMKEALRYYNGKAVVNSVNGTKKSIEAILPAVKKYGAVVICMPFDEKGIALKAEERLEVARKIVEAASGYGIHRKNIIIDCLSLAAKNSQEYLMEGIKALALIKKELGVKVMLGVGNISFGMPQRSLMDRTYLAMALGAGMDTLLMNVDDNEMWDTIHASRLILNMDQGGEEYKKRYLEI
ncbi:MAG: dihydropteroate synthase [Eubacteriaceae bacterium]|nr:dihydropteroate synthase [Eubacteriaceae bacterium]